MRPASSSSNAFSQFRSGIFFQNSQQHAAELDILTPHAHFQAFAASSVSSIPIQAHRGPPNARPSPSSSSNPSHSRLEREAFKSSDAQSSPSASNVSSLRFAH